MKILAISNIFEPGFIGGYEILAADLTKGLKGLGHDVHVLTSDYFLDIDGSGEIPVHRSMQNTTWNQNLVNPYSKGQSKYFNFFNLRQFGVTLREIQPDLVILFSLRGLGSYGFMKYLEFTKIPTLLYLADDIFSEVARDSTEYVEYSSLFGQLCIPKTFTTVSMSKRLINEIEGAYEVEIPDYTLVSGWVNFTDLPKEPLNIESDVFRFVFCSQIAESKGINILLEAVAILRKEGITGFVVDIYGGGDVEILLKKVIQRNLGQYVKYQGRKSRHEIMQAFSTYEALLFPTEQREPFGLVAIEAASVGCLPIMTKGIGASEYLEDKVTSLHIDRSAKALSVEMKKVMNMSKVELESLQSRCETFVQDNFNFDDKLQEIELICRSKAVPWDAQRMATTTMQIENAMQLLESTAAFRQKRTIQIVIPTNVHRFLRKVSKLIPARAINRLRNTIGNWLSLR